MSRPLTLEEAHERLLREMEERRVAEELLRESEELYRHVVSLSGQFVWTASPEGALLTISPEYYDLTGLDPSSLPRFAIHPDDRERVMSAWDEAVRAGTRHRATYRLCLRNGEHRYFRARAAPRLDSEGRVVRWYGTTEDIDDQVRAEHAYLAAEERYRLAAMATNDAIWDLDPIRGEIRWAESVAPLFGYPGRDNATTIAWWEEKVHPEDRERVSESLTAALNGSHSRWGEHYRYQRADGSYATVHDRGFIIRDEEGRALRAVGAMSDVTEQRRAQAELQRMQTELIHVSRLSAMGAMASTLAHELNQPLTAVSSYVRGSRVMLEGVPGAEAAEVLRALEAAEAGALRAGHIVRRLRELVARGNVSFKPEDIGALIEEACVLALVDAHLRGVRHRIKVDPAARWVQADRIQVQQVLINLIRNAVQAMADQPRRELTITARSAKPDSVQVCIADTGPGFSPEIRDALFSPFQSSKEGGLGIGLSISRTIVEAHGGKIWAEDSKDGALFCFTLPSAKKDLPSPRSKA